MDAKRELLKAKIANASVTICYFKGTTLNKNYINIIVVDDMIYKFDHGKENIYENQSKTTDKIWTYINSMQGVIREEAAKIKTLSHVKGSVRDELVVNFKDVSCTLTNKLIDEESKNIYNNIVKSILTLLNL